jgi:hypothetical protein
MSVFHEPGWTGKSTHLMLENEKALHMQGHKGWVDLQYGGSGSGQGLL